MFPKAAAYVRVSTNSNEQAHSLEFQINYCKLITPIIIDVTTDKGVYSYDVAVSKVRRATQMARDAGYPLRLTYAPE